MVGTVRPALVRRRPTAGADSMREVQHVRQMHNRSTKSSARTHTRHVATPGGMHRRSAPDADH